MIKEETELLYAFKGAYSAEYLEGKTDYEVMLIHEAYKDIKETERIAIENAKNNQNGTEIVQAPIKLKNSRFNVPEDDDKNGSE